jgi:hypothetical protein
VEGASNADDAGAGDAGWHWCFTHPEELLQRHKAFLAIVPAYGIVHAAEDHDAFEAWLNDKRPSLRKTLFLTHTSFWIHGELS